MSESKHCAGCALQGASRREFLRDALAGALLAFVPVSIVRGSGGRTDKAYPIPAADGASIDKEESVIVARFQDRMYAFSLACPHQNTAIRWEASERRFQCPKHHSRYRPDGTFIEGRATRGLDRFAVRRDGERLLVNLDELYRQDENANEWASAFVELVAREK